MLQWCVSPYHCTDAPNQRGRTPGSQTHGVPAAWASTSGWAEAEKCRESGKPSSDALEARHPRLRTTPESTSGTDGSCTTIEPKMSAEYGNVSVTPSPRKFPRTRAPSATATERVTAGNGAEKCPRQKLRSRRSHVSAVEPSIALKYEAVQSPPS